MKISYLFQYIQIIQLYLNIYISYIHLWVYIIPYVPYIIISIFLHTTVIVCSKLIGKANLLGNKSKIRHVCVR